MEDKFLRITCSNICIYHFPFKEGWTKLDQYHHKRQDTIEWGKAGCDRIIRLVRAKPYLHTVKAAKDRQAGDRETEDQKWDQQEHSIITRILPAK